MKEQLLAAAAKIRCEYPRDPCATKKGDFTPCDNCAAKAGIQALADSTRPDPSGFCKSFDAWAEACAAPLPTDDQGRSEWRKAFSEHWGFISLAIRKSCLLDRLIYGGEKLRKETCPVHKGRWSGCSIDPQSAGCDCRHDICITGWQRNPGDPQSRNTGLMVVRAVEEKP